MQTASNYGDLANIEEDVPIGYKRQPLEDVARAKRSKDNANILKVPKATDTPTTI